MTRAAAANEGMNTYLTKSAEAIEAAAAGDTATVLARQAEARASAGSVFDAQILLLETMRASMPMQTHKSMFEVRLTMMRAMRAIILSDPANDDGTLSVTLRKLGGDARLAATQMRANWKHEGAPLHNIAAQLNSPARLHMLTQLDEAFATIAGTSDEVATTLGALPPGPVAPGTSAVIVNQIAQIETRTLAAIREMGVAASQVQ
jgi:hypothetical protein